VEGEQELLLLLLISLFSFCKKPLAKPIVMNNSEDLLNTVAKAVEGQLQPDLPQHVRLNSNQVRVSHTAIPFTPTPLSRIFL
jgi:hypothetical protein